MKPEVSGDHKREDDCDASPRNMKAKRAILSTQKGIRRKPDGSDAKDEAVRKKYRFVSWVPPVGVTRLRVLTH